MKPKWTTISAKESDEEFLRKLKEENPKCLRCGRCCTNRGVPCGNLLKLPNGKTRCMVYSTRLILRDVNGKPFCTERTNVPYDFLGCPYNSGKPFKPLGKVAIAKASPANPITRAQSCLLI